MMSKQSKLGNLVVFTFTNSKIFKFAFQILSESQFLRNNQWFAVFHGFFKVSDLHNHF